MTHDIYILTDSEGNTFLEAFQLYHAPADAEIVNLDVAEMDLPGTSARLACRLIYANANPHFPLSFHDLYNGIWNRLETLIDKNLLTTNQYDEIELDYLDYESIGDDEYLLRLCFGPTATFDNVVKYLQSYGGRLPRYTELNNLSNEEN